METIKRRLPAFFITFILVLSIILMIPGMLLAQEDEEAEDEEAVEEEIKPEELIFETTLTKIQAEGGEESFSFDFGVIYMGGDQPYGIDPEDTEKEFNISVDYPSGWIAAVLSGSQKASAINLTRVTRKSLKLLAIPRVKQEPGEYTFTATFESAIEGDPLEGSIEFTGVVTASYEITLTTKSGMLSTDITSGKDNHYKLIVTNNSSTSVENIKLSSSEPVGWRVNFDMDVIESIEAGEEEEIDVTINPPEKTIAGDYMLTFRASSENSNDDIELRVTVETPTIWGAVGIGIIVVVIVAVAVVFTRLGRR